MKLRGFVVYAHEDVEMKEKVLRQLAGVDELGKVWHDGCIAVGSCWAKEIATNLRRTDLVVLLVSPDFNASAFIQSNELALALGLAQRGRICLAPVRIVDGVVPAALANFQWLPNVVGMPDYVSGWEDQNRALADVARGIQAACSEHIAKLGHARVKRNWFGAALALTAPGAFIAHRALENQVVHAADTWMLELLAFPLTVALVYFAGMVIFRSFRASPRRDIFVGVAPQFSLPRFFLGAAVLMLLWGGIDFLMGEQSLARWVCGWIGLGADYVPSAHGLLQYSFPGTFAAAAFYSGAVLRSRQRDLLPPPLAPESETDLLVKSVENGLAISGLCALAAFLGFGEELRVFGEHTEYHTFVMFQTGWGFARGFIPRLPI
jgi:hypothetical protein